MNTTIRLSVRPTDSFYGEPRWLSIVLPTTRLTLYYTDDLRQRMVEALRPHIGEVHPVVDLESLRQNPEARPWVFLYPGADARTFASAGGDSVTLFVHHADLPDGGLTVSGSVDDMRRLASVLEFAGGVSGSAGTASRSIVDRVLGAIA